MNKDIELLRLVEKDALKAVNLVLEITTTLLSTLDIRPSEVRAVYKVVRKAHDSAVCSLERRFNEIEKDLKESEDE